MTTNLWKHRIRDLSVRGFKSIADKQSIAIKPLTILAGANNSGKSAMIQPLLLLKQSLEVSFDPGALYLAGPNVKFTAADQFLTRGPANAEKRLEINLGFGGQPQLGLSLLKQPDKAIETEEQRWTYDGNTKCIRKDAPKVLPDRFWLRVKVGGNGEHLGTRLLDSHATGAPIALLSEVLQKVLHVPGNRGNPERTYPVTGTGPYFPGTFQPYIASIITNWQSEDEIAYQALNSELQQVGLASRVVARKLNEAEIDLLVNRLPEGKGNDLVSVADVGLGVSHLLPVLVALRAASKGQVVYVEEPEIHLHPRAQVRLAGILASAAKRDVRVIAETHSSLLLRAIQTLIAKGELAPDLVRLHWFSRDKRGVTRVSSVALDQNGAFGKWPQDFGDVALDSEQDYLDAVESRPTR